jgi:hypothetical protein
MDADFFLCSVFALGHAVHGKDAAVGGPRIIGRGQDSSVRCQVCGECQAASDSDRNGSCNVISVIPVGTAH